MRFNGVISLQPIPEHLKDLRRLIQYCAIVSKKVREQHEAKVLLTNNLAILDQGTRETE